MTTQVRAIGLVAVLLSQSVSAFQARQTSVVPAGEKCLAEAPVAALRKARATSSSERPSHDGMVWINGGEFSMGSDDPRFPDAQPVQKVHVDGFWMDKTTVTGVNLESGRFAATPGLWWSLLVVA